MSRIAAPLLVLLIASPSVAQVQSRPTDPPLVTAANEAWYQSREPIPFAGELYYRAGPAVFFDGNTMVRSGYHNGVPLYMETTIEPFSVILVPVRRGLLQPYERLRRGDLAGTTASRTPSFPVRATADAYTMPEAPAAPTQLQQPIGAVGAISPDAPIARAESLVGTTGAGAVERVYPPEPWQQKPIETLRKPENNDGLWVAYSGSKWVSAGAAVPLRSAEFRAVGQYAGFPVFVRVNEQGTIYLPTRAGLVAPYKTK
jgi:hypothetical protein